MELSGSRIAIDESFIADCRYLGPILEMSNGGNLQITGGLEWMYRSVHYIHAFISVLGMLACPGPEICGDSHIKCAEIYRIIRIVFNPCARALRHEQRLSSYDSLPFSVQQMINDVIRHSWSRNEQRYRLLGYMFDLRCGNYLQHYPDGPTISVSQTRGQGHLTSTALLATFSRTPTQPA
jgi:hypothetical protein